MKFYFTLVFILTFFCSFRTSIPLKFEETIHLNFDSLIVKEKVNFSLLKSPCDYLKAIEKLRDSSNNLVVKGNRKINSLTKRELEFLDNQVIMQNEIGKALIKRYSSKDIESCKSELKQIEDKTNIWNEYVEKN